MCNKCAQSNLARRPRRGAVAHVRPVGPCGQWQVTNSPPKVPLPVDRSRNPTTCLIPGPVRSTMPNGIRIRSAVFPQCTGQTDRPTDTSFTEKFDDYRPLYAPRATRPKNGHRQLWTKYAVHIMLHKNVRTLRNVFIQKIVESVPRIGSMINTAIMVNISQTAVTIGLLGNRGDSRSRGRRTSFTPGPAGFPQQTVPLPTLQLDEGWLFFPLPRYSRGFPTGFYRSRSHAKLYHRLQNCFQD